MFLSGKRSLRFICVSTIFVYISFYFRGYCSVFLDGMYYLVMNGEFVFIRVKWVYIYIICMLYVFMLNKIYLMVDILLYRVLFYDLLGMLFLISYYKLKILIEVLVYVFIFCNIKVYFYILNFSKMMF